MGARTMARSRADSAAASSVPPRVWMDLHGVLRVDYGFHASITLDLVRKAHRLHQAIAAGRRVPVLVLGHGILDVEWEAYRFAQRPEVGAITAAVALLATTPLERHLAQLFLLYHRPAHPVRVFREDRAAVDWLRQYRLLS